MTNLKKADFEFWLEQFSVDEGDSQVLWRIRDRCLKGCVKLIGGETEFFNRKKFLLPKSVASVTFSLESCKSCWKGCVEKFLVKNQHWSR